MTEPVHPPADPKKLLEHWNEWERGDETAGKVISDLKRAGMREFLEKLAEG